MQTSRTSGSPLGMTWLIPHPLDSLVHFPTWLELSDVGVTPAHGHFKASQWNHLLALTARPCATAPNITDTVHLAFLPPPQNYPWYPLSPGRRWENKAENTALSRDGSVTHDRSFHDSCVDAVPLSRGFRGGPTLAGTTQITCTPL